MMTYAHYRHILCLVVFIVMAAETQAADPVTAVTELDLKKYLGTWYEIARLPQFFQRNCKSDIKANYTENGDGTIGVHNQCVNFQDVTHHAYGKAKIPDPSAPAKLRVTFAPGWLSSWLNLVWGDYWVIALDDDYQWALIGEPSRKYLWILSRKPSLDRKIVEDLKARAVKMGYDLTPLIISGSVTE